MQISEIILEAIQPIKPANINKKNALTLLAEYKKLKNKQIDKPAIVASDIVIKKNNETALNTIAIFTPPVCCVFS